MKYFAMFLGGIIILAICVYATSKWDRPDVVPYKFANYRTGKMVTAYVPRGWRMATTDNGVVHYTCDGTNWGAVRGL